MHRDTPKYVVRQMEWDCREKEGMWGSAVAFTYTKLHSLNWNKNTMRVWQMYSLITSTLMAAKIIIFSKYAYSFHCCHKKKKDLKNNLYTKKEPGVSLSNITYMWESIFKKVTSWNYFDLTLNQLFFRKDIKIMNYIATSYDLKLQTILM